jgi:hypothetical protein
LTVVLGGGQAAPRARVTIGITEHKVRTSLGSVVLTVFFYFDFDWRLLFDAVVVLPVDEMPPSDEALVGYAPLADEGGFVVDVVFV